MPRKITKPGTTVVAARKDNPLKQHLDQLTPAKRVAFAERAKTTPESLRIAANAYRTGKLNLSPEFAARIERASKGELHRAQLSPVCARCPHVKKPRR